MPPPDAPPSTALDHVPTSTPAELDADAVRGLTEPQRRALEVLATGGRYRDAARAAGVPLAQIWTWARSLRVYRDALTQPLEIHDRRLDLLDATLLRGLHADAPTEDRELALRAARTLGSGTAPGIAALEAQAQRRRSARAPAVAVALHLDLGALAPVLRLDAAPTLDLTAARAGDASAGTLPRRVTLELPAPAPLLPTLDATLDLDEAPRPTVAATQPRRARSASRKTRPDRTA